MPESAPTPAPVPAELQWAGNSEKSIKPVAADIADAPPPRPPEGTIDPVRLSQEIQANFETLENCRVDVARARRVELSKVVADQLLLRWTIEPSGLIGSTEVVAARPVDLDLMDCVKAAMSRWSFTRPRGGAVHVERAVHLPPRSLTAFLRRRRPRPCRRRRFGALSPSGGPAVLSMDRPP